MALLQTFKSWLYHLITSSHIMLYIYPAMRPLIDHFAKPGPKTNYKLTDRRGNSYTVCKVDGRVYPCFGISRLSTVQDITIRPSDVILCGYPKTGCHWVYEILHMLLSGKAQLSKGSSEFAMIDLIPDILLDSLPSPRLLSSHQQFTRLPKGVQENQNKIILTVRNPKDTVVSYYNHILVQPHAYTNYQGGFSDYFHLFMGPEHQWGSYFDYYATWGDLMKTNEHKRILLVSFEDNKANPVANVKRIAKFLDFDISDELAVEIVSQSSFSSMKTKRDAESRGQLLRKGDVGDWTNWLSEEESLAVDHAWQDKLADFEYQPSYHV